MNNQFLKQVFFFLALNTLLLFMVNYLVDPLQIYRQQTVLKPLYTEEQRLQVPGLINSFADKAEIALVGSSMTSNFSHKEIESAFKQPLLKLSIDGSTPFEQIFVLKQLLQQKNNTINRVIWGLDVLRFNAYYGEFSQPKDVYPFHLYSRDFVDKVKYSLNVDTLTHSLQTLVSNITSLNFIRKKDDIRALNLWENNKGCYIVFDNYKDVLPQKNWMDEIKVSFQEKQVAAYIEEIRVITAQHPDITFELFFPPHPILRYQLLKNKNRLQLTYQLRKYIASHLLNIPNVNFYDPASRDDLIVQLDHYKDLGHYDGFMNQHILTMMTEKESVEGIEDIRINDQRLINTVSHFDYSLKEKSCRNTQHITASSKITSSVW